MNIEIQNLYLQISYRLNYGNGFIDTREGRISLQKDQCYITAQDIKQIIGKPNCSNGTAWNYLEKVSEYFGGITRKRTRLGCIISIEQHNDNIMITDSQHNDNLATDSKEVISDSEQHIDNTLTTESQHNDNSYIKEEIRDKLKEETREEEEESSDSTTSLRNELVAMVQKLSKQHLIANNRKYQKTKKDLQIVEELSKEYSAKEIKLYWNRFCSVPEDFYLDRPITFPLFKATIADDHALVAIDTKTLWKKMEREFGNKHNVRVKGV